MKKGMETGEKQAVEEHSGVRLSTAGSWSLSLTSCVPYPKHSIP